MRRRLSKRALSVIGVSGLLFLAGTTAQAGWLFVLASGVLGLLGASFFVRHRLGSITVKRTVPRRVRVGDDLRLGLTLHNDSRRRSPILRITDGLAAYEPPRVLVEPIAAGGRSEIELTRTALRRGAFAEGEVTIRSGSPFGFVTTETKVAVESRLVVVPRWVELRSFPILEPSSFPSDVLHERARTGAGEEYIGVREYRPGDPPRAVHWKSTARAGKLIVREFQEEVASRVVLVIAGRDAGQPPDSAFELLVSAAASIAMYAVVTGHPVDLVRPGAEGPERISEPDRGALLDWLAHARPADAPLSALVADAIDRGGRRGTVVLIAPTAGEAGASLPDAVRLVQSAGSRAIVVAARSSSWEEKGSHHDDSALRSAVGGRTALKVVAKGGDLRRCLEA